jgi:hypothetical protein
MAQINSTTPQAHYLATLAIVSQKRKVRPVLFGVGVKKEMSWKELEGLFLARVCTCTQILPLCHFLVAKDLEMLAPAASFLSLEDENIPELARSMGEPGIDADAILKTLINTNTNLL